MTDPRTWVVAAAIVVAAVGLVACGGETVNAPDDGTELEQGRGHETEEAPEPQAPPVAQKFVMTVTGMTCEHCEASIQREVKFCAGVKSITASHKDRKVVVEGVGMDETEVQETIEKLGFRVLATLTLSEKPDAPEKR